MNRVLVQINSLALGGTQINAVDLAAALKDHGYESVLVGPRDTIPEGPTLFEVAAERNVRLETFERPRTTLQGSLMMARLARKYKADLVHVYGSWTARPALLGSCFLGRRPLALTIYEMAVDPDTPKSPALIVGTQYLVEDLANRGEGVDLISPPVDTTRDDSNLVDTSEFLLQHSIREDQRKIVMVTRLDDDMKACGVEQAIAAVDNIAHSDVVLVIVGGGDAEDRIRTEAQRVNSRHGREVVVMTGPISDPRPAYAAADVMIGMGGSAARSLSFGKPLIVTGEYGWFKTFTPETSGELFRNSFWSPSSMDQPVEKLIACLEPLLADADLRAELGTYGRAFATTKFGLSAMSGRLAQIYARTMKHYGFRVWMLDIPDEIATLQRGIKKKIKTIWSRQQGLFRSGQLLQSISTWGKK